MSASVVIPARNAERTLPRVLEALHRQEVQPLEVIVVDDSSTDRTVAIARDLGARVIPSGRHQLAGGARNAGLDVAQGDTVVFLDADAVPHDDWGVSLARAFDEFPGSIIGCARTFEASTSWGWVAHLQVETPYLPRGKPREVQFVSSYCMAVPRSLGLRFDESYGGEDAFFCARARSAGARIVFDPRIVASHEHERRSFADLRAQQRRLAFGLARAARAGILDRRRAALVRFPFQYFLLLRLPALYRRLAEDEPLRRRFRSLLPQLVLAEWTLGASAIRYMFSSS